MEPNLQKSEQLSDIVQHPSNAELPVNKPSDGTIKEPEAKHQTISLTVQGSQLSLPLGKVESDFSTAYGVYRRQGY